ncbi:NAD(P)-dependent alcohol dehydrogenase [Gordonia sp. NPDC127522]|uniref:NAD(P)-dependent alcohol dehydrogenase n=1 Tax=Gordonia sp. NPDC127522 TaxID=3345390 RepID=UPI0036453ED8
MRAALLTGYGEDFAMADVDDPAIENPDDVIVRVGAAGFCRTDIHLWRGEFDAMHKDAGVGLPFICGHETAGWIEEIGPGVKNVSVGDAVVLHMYATCGFCKACRAGDDMHCKQSTCAGVFAPGGFAQYVRTNARAVVPLSEGITPVEAAPLGDAGLTAYRAVRKALPLAVPGTRTVVIGAGGLGHIGIQALRALSETEIIVIDQNAAALDLARGWGADHVVLAEADHSHVEHVRELTKGVGAEVVIDYVGEGGAQRDAVDLLADNGMDLMVGYGGKLEVEILTQAIFPETSFVGNVGGSYNEMVELTALVARGVVEFTTTTYPLNRINDALRALDSGQLRGRGVLIPD